MARRRRRARRGEHQGQRRPPPPFFPERLLWWLTFQLILSLLPLLFAALAIRSPGWNDVISRGEMILIAVVLAGSDVGAAIQLVTTSPWRRTARAAIIGFGSIFCILTAFLYADVRGAVDSPSIEAQDIVHTRTNLYSYALLPVAILMGIGNSYLTHVEDVSGRRYDIQ
jgi:hypothetical protein